MKRLIESGYNVRKVFYEYSNHDPRRWTVIVDPGDTSVLVTCYTNKEELHDCVFEFNDGGCRVPKNFQLHTKSIEVIINYLNEYNICNNGKKEDQARSKKENHPEVVE